MRTKPFTVKELKALCDMEIRKGNGDKVIMISDDDEGNGYHYLWYSFMTVKELEKPVKYKGELITPTPVNTSDNIAKKEDTIILG